MSMYLPPEAAFWAAFTNLQRDRLRRMREESEKGAMSPEMLIIIAGLVLVAVTVMGIVSAKIIAEAEKLKVGG